MGPNCVDGGQGWLIFAMPRGKDVVAVATGRRWCLISVKAHSLVSSHRWEESRTSRGSTCIVGFGALVPDRQSFVNVERDYPKRSASEKFLLAQADFLLRDLGYVRTSDGSYRLPGNQEPATRQRRRRSR